MITCVPHRHSLVRISANSLVRKGEGIEEGIRKRKGEGERKGGKQPVLPVKNISPAFN